ncbi:hypothetical protein F2Q65_15665 [Thiohalocapsa marina]|uniref:Uncharacterized protein n=1 Tax=Thiohalocapsa marina TaxID=424902 RepID=A0A5M8FFL0_9GAMM|nr:hypothetical protein [Thiohalocapsa marina]KAA6183497.1 hypothetical protein F2Q65_15665 [Thiohalocapsa marina]
MAKQNNRRSLAHSAADRIITSTHVTVDAVNVFTEQVFHTRGGRIGSGMGSVIEALWGFHLNGILKKDQDVSFELGWIYGHEYNDFACILRGEEWNPETKKGELFRVEVKSMVASADESKAHFDRLQHEFAENELLAVFLWDWKSINDQPRNVYPAILDYFVGYALPIAQLRDALHLERGGSFIQKGNCPDGCAIHSCAHVGEPLNASGVRERRSGPESAKGAGVSYAANFGGMLRMLGSRGKTGKDILKKEYASDPTKARFLDFMARNFPRVARAIK